MHTPTRRQPPPAMLLTQRLDTLNLHPSGPGSSLESEKRSSPIPQMDPKATLEKFIQHLLDPSHNDAEPHLVAIGYELEALMAIYPSLKMVMSSRPASMLPPPADEEDEEEEGGGADAVEKKGKPSFPASAPMSQHSKSWDNAVFDDAIWSPGERIRYEVSIPLWDEGEVLPGLEADSMLKEEAPLMRVLVSLHPTYPNTAPPQLQLLGRYLGNFGIDAGLFGDVTRTFITSSGVTFTPGDVCVFEGLTYARTVAQTWYATRLSTGAEGEKARDADRRRGREGRAMEDHFPTSPARTSHDRTGNGTGNGTGKDDSDEDDSAGASAPRRPTPPRPTFSYSRPTLDDTGAHGSAPAPTTISSSSSSMPLTTPPSVTQANEGFFPHFIIHVSAPIVDRKSTFIGHAIRVTDEREVPLVIHELLSDRKIAKAAHPAMFAYRIVREVGGVAGKVIQTDCDDDGETAAGSRLAHLLDILELENVLVVVSRWFGGVHLGPDRFKHINQAARDALEVGGFLVKESTAGGGGGAGKGRRR